MITDREIEELDHLTAESFKRADKFCTWLTVVGLIVLVALTIVLLVF